MAPDTERESPAAPGGGRLNRRGERLRAAVLAAAVEELVEHGVGGTTVAGVAARAGVHETSLYRRWGTRDRLIVDALHTHSRAALPMPDTGSAREDLRRLLRSLAALLATPIGTALVRTAAVTADDADLVASRAAFWTARLADARIVVERGVERGELAPDTDAALVLEALVAPLYLRLLVTGQPLDDDLTRSLPDLLLDGCAGRPPGAANG